MVYKTRPCLSCSAVNCSTMAQEAIRTIVGVIQCLNADHMKPFIDENIAEMAKDALAVTGSNEHTNGEKQVLVWQYARTICDELVPLMQQQQDSIVQKHGVEMIQHLYMICHTLADAITRYESALKLLIDEDGKEEED